MARSDFQSTVLRGLPDRVRNSGAWLYDLVRERRADSEFSPSDATATPDPDAPTDIVLVVIDALRTDYLDPDLTPYLCAHLDANLVTAAPWTFPSVSSIITGEYPHEHGAIRTSDTLNEGHQIRLPQKLDSAHPTLTEAVAGAGYETFGFFGFEMPFQALGGQFQSHRIRGEDSAESVLGSAVEAIHSARGPTFSYVHLADLHEPINPPAEYLEALDVDTSIPKYNSWDYTEETDPEGKALQYVENRKQVYRAAMAYVDDVLESLVAELGGDCATLITSDHGEAFWEYAGLDARNFDYNQPSTDTGHGGTPYESVARVPLATVGIDDIDPSGTGSTIDIAPTILDLIGLEPGDRTGESLRGDYDDRIALCESARYGYEKKAIYRGDRKLIHSRGDGTSLLFELPDEELLDRPDEETLETFLECFSHWIDESESERNVSSTTERRLEALGYK